MPDLDVVLTHVMIHSWKVGNCSQWRCTARNSEPSQKTNIFVATNRFHFRHVDFFFNVCVKRLDMYRVGLCVCPLFTTNQLVVKQLHIFINKYHVTKFSAYFLFG